MKTILNTMTSANKVGMSIIIVLALLTTGAVEKPMAKSQLASEFRNEVHDKKIIDSSENLNCTTASTGKLQAQNIIEYGIIRDVSESSVEATEFDADNIFRKVVTELQLKDSKKAVNFRTVLCGERRIAEIRLAFLPESDPWFSSTTERNKAIGHFLAKGKSDLDHLASQPCDQTQTNLYRTVVAMTKEFSPDASEKKLVIFSDGIEVSSAFNATTYKSDPSRVMTDFDSMVETLERDTKLPDLAGFTVILVTPGNTEMELWMSRFWKKLLEMRGAVVQVKAAF